MGSRLKMESSCAMMILITFRYSRISMLGACSLRPRLLFLIEISAAPIHLLNVQPGQPVELRINPRQQELYYPPPGVRTFGGSGQRLGAPVPVPGGGTSSVSRSALISATMTTSTSTQEVDVLNRFEVDLSKPTTSIQVRLADGTRYELCILQSKILTCLASAASYVE